MKRFTCIAVLAILVTACGIGGHYRTEVDANNVTVQSLEESITALEEFDDSAINESRSNRLDRLQTLEAALKVEGHILTAEEAQALADLSAMGEPYHPFSVESGIVSSKLRRSHNQLKALNHDLESNLLPSDSVRYLVNHERRFAAKALAEAEKLMNHADEEMAAKAVWHQKMDSLEQNLIHEQK